MTRTSPAEVRGMFTRVRRAAEAAGIQPRGTEPAWHVYEEQHVGWQIDVGESTPVFLGKTAREASLTLGGMERAFLLVPAREEVR